MMENTSQNQDREIEAADDRNQEQHYKDNPNEFLEEIKQWAQEERDDNDNPNYPMPVNVKEVLEITSSTRMRSSGIKATLLIECDDGENPQRIL